MSYYRLYFMDSFSGHIERFEEFDALDDGEAMAFAKSMTGPKALELWCQHRKVTRLESLDIASQLLAQRRKLKAVKTQIEPPRIDDDKDLSENRSA